MHWTGSELSPDVTFVVSYCPHPRAFVTEVKMTSHPIWHWWGSESWVAPCPHTHLLGHRHSASAHDWIFKNLKAGFISRVLVHLPFSPEPWKLMGYLFTTVLLCCLCCFPISMGLRCPSAISLSSPTSWNQVHSADPSLSNLPSSYSSFLPSPYHSSLTTPEGICSKCNSCLRILDGTNI